MGSVLSATVFVLKDEAGTPRTEAWIAYEFRAAAYVLGGENIDLSPYMRRVEQLLCNPMSGALNYWAKPNDSDIPGTAGSSRLQLYYIGSSAVTVNTSGLGISIASGVQPFISGQLLSGNISGVTLITLISGTFLTQATAWRPATTFSELAADIAISGTRARVLALGY